MTGALTWLFALALTCLYEEDFGLATETGAMVAPEWRDEVPHGHTLTIVSKHRPTINPQYYCQKLISY